MPAKPDLLSLLQRRVIVADGAMGSLLYARGLAGAGLPGPALNLLRPADVRAVHTAYLTAGARLIETNSYAAGRLALAPHGLGDRVSEINTAAARLAREAVAAFAGDAGPDGVQVAGSIGPAGRGPEPLESAEAREIYAEQAVALAAGGVDLFLLETFSDLDDLLCAVHAVAASCPGVPVGAQMAFSLSGTTATGVTPRRMVERLRGEPVAVVGANCGGGEAAAMQVAEAILPLTDLPVSIFPNRGLARIDEEGRPQYQAGPEYFAEHGLRLAAMGVNIIGGCCGTSPEEIARLAALIGERHPAARERKSSVTVRLAAGAHGGPFGTFAGLNAPVVVDETGARVFAPVPPKPAVTAFLRDRVSVVAEVDPPRGMDPARQLRGAVRLLEAGADAITVADNPLSVIRMSNLALSARLISELDANVLLHVSCRDRNLIGNQSHLMGAAALGITNVLIITGDPVATQAYKGSSGVFDLSSAGFVKLIRGMNEGENLPGGAAMAGHSFCIGTAFNTGARSLENEAKRVARKVEAGAHYVMTQPCFDAATANRILDLLAPLGVPVYVGVLPMISGPNAEFLHNEVPGIRIPDEVRAKMQGYSGERGIERGIELAEELVAEVAPRSRAMYFVPPFDRYSIIARLTAFAKGLRVA